MTDDIPSTTETKHRIKLHGFLINYPVIWSLFSDLYLWVLVICAVEEQHGTPEWLWYLGEIRALMLQLELSDSTAVMDVAKRFMWIDDVAVVGTEVLAAGIDGLLQRDLQVDPSLVDL